MEYMAAVLILWVFTMFVDEKIIMITGFDRASVMLICIGGVFIISSLFPLIGIPLRDLKSGEVVFDEGVMYMAIILGIGSACLGVVQGIYKKNRS